MNQKYELRPYQKEAVESVLDKWENGTKRTLLVMPTGCHAKGQKVLLSDGRETLVEDIKEGDRLLGPDGTERSVLFLHHGEMPLFKIIPVKGEPFTVTENHELTLEKIGERGDDPESGKIVDVSVQDYLSGLGHERYVYKLVRSDAIEAFPGAEKNAKLPIDPYFLGILIRRGVFKKGYGISITALDEEIVSEILRQAPLFHAHIREKGAGETKTYFFRSDSQKKEDTLLKNTLSGLGLFGCGPKDRFVPQIYKTAPIRDRLLLLAGLMDSDAPGYEDGYDYFSESPQLAEDIAYVSRSCGLAAYVSEFGFGEGFLAFPGTYYKVEIRGGCSMIPCRIERKICEKRLQKKNVLRTSFAVEPAGSGEYFGFTVDGDNRYLLNDFTVTHNCGKTVILANVAGSRSSEENKTLILAHRGELLEQAAEKVEDICGIECAVEKAESTSVGTKNEIVVGSVQTLGRRSRLEKFERDAFKTVIVDEAHHTAADSYTRVLDWFSAAKVLGVTATPDRADKKKIGDIFENVAYEYSLVDAVKEGYLVPIKAVMSPLKIDISDVKVQNGDYAAGETGLALEPYLEKIADEMLRECEGRKTVVFLPLIATSRKFMSILNRKGFRAAEVNGDSSDREEVLRDFDAGKYNVLCNAMLLTEGWDCPSVDCIVVLRPTRSDTLYRQMVGRGMRLSPETGKKDLLLLDFLWLTSERKLVRDPADLICEDDKQKALVRAAMKKGKTDVLEAAEEANDEIVRKREEAIAAKLASLRKKKKRCVDPLQYAASVGDRDILEYEPVFSRDKGPVTARQKTDLEAAGLDPEGIKTCGEASAFLKALQKRKVLGLATPKQIRLLEQKGFRRVGTWRKQDATEVISLIQVYHWQVPKWFITPETFVPTAKMIQNVKAVRMRLEGRNQKALSC